MYLESMLVLETDLNPSSSVLENPDKHSSTCFRYATATNLGEILLYRTDRFLVICKGWWADLNHLMSALPLLSAEI